MNRNRRPANSSGGTGGQFASKPSADTPTPESLQLPSRSPGTSIEHQIHLPLWNARQDSGPHGTLIHENNEWEWEPCFPYRQFAIKATGLNSLDDITNYRIAMTTCCVGKILAEMLNEDCIDMKDVEKIVSGKGRSVGLPSDSDGRAEGIELLIAARIQEDRGRLDNNEDSRYLEPWMKDVWVSLAGREMWEPLSGANHCWQPSIMWVDEVVDYVNELCHLHNSESLSAVAAASHIEKEWPAMLMHNALTYGGYKSAWQNRELPTALVLSLFSIMGTDKFKEWMIEYKQWVQKSTKKSLKWDAPELIFNSYGGSMFDLATRPGPDQKDAIEIFKILVEDKIKQQPHRQPKAVVRSVMRRITKSRCEDSSVPPRVLVQNYTNLASLVDQTFNDETPVSRAIRDDCRHRLEILQRKIS